MPYPDDYNGATAPDGWISPEAQAREEAHSMAGDLYDASCAVLDAASRLMDAVELNDLSPPAQWTARETAELMRRMDDIARVLRDLREGRMPGEKREKTNDR
jgi:hypothetical protein